MRMSAVIIVSLRIETHVMLALCYHVDMINVSVSHGSLFFWFSPSHLPFLYISTEKSVYYQSVNWLPQRQQLTLQESALQIHNVFWLAFFFFWKKKIQASSQLVRLARTAAICISNGQYASCHGLCYSDCYKSSYD